MWLDEIEIVLRSLLGVDYTEDIETRPFTELSFLKHSLFSHIPFVLQQSIALAIVLRIEHIRSSSSWSQLLTMILMVLLILHQEIRFLYPHYPCILYLDINAWVLNDGHWVIVSRTDVCLELVFLWLLAADPFADTNIKHRKVIKDLVILSIVSALYQKATSIYSWCMRHTALRWPIILNFLSLIIHWTLVKLGWVHELPLDFCLSLLFCIIFLSLIPIKILLILGLLLCLWLYLNPFSLFPFLLRIKNP